MRVKATREGLIGGTTASGYVIDAHVPFVALPSGRALHRVVRVSNPANSKACFAMVLDVGPWNGGPHKNPDGSIIDTSDDAYVFGGQRPQAESGTDRRGRRTNGAGIDLGEWVWKALGMQDNADVEWEFIGG